MDEELAKVTQERDDLLESMREIYEIANSQISVEASQNKAPGQEMRERLTALLQIHTLACIVSDYEGYDILEDNEA